jgi:hypothetical protein
VAILEHARAHGHHCLHDVRLGHLRGAHAPEALPDLLDDRVIAHELAPEKLRNGRTSAIVGCGPESAGGDHRPGALDPIAHRLGDAIRIVADGGAMHDLDADLRERAREIGGVRVDGEAEQQLVTDGDYFDLHEGCAESDEGPGKKTITNRAHGTNRTQRERSASGPHWA